MADDRALAQRASQTAAACDALATAALVGWAAAKDVTDEASDTEPGCTWLTVSNAANGWCPENAGGCNRKDDWAVLGTADCQLQVCSS